MSSQLVTVTIPSVSVQKLSSKDRSRGVKPAKGWVRHVVSTDPTQRGGYALIAGPSGAFAPTGEMQLPVGSVVVDAHYDHTARILKVAYDGTLIVLTTPEGEVWRPLRERTASFCAAVDAALAMTQQKLLAVDVAQHDTARSAAAAKLAQCDEPGREWGRTLAVKDLEAATVALATAQARLEALPTVPVDPRAELVAERERLMARLAEIDALLS